MRAEGEEALARLRAVGEEQVTQASENTLKGFEDFDLGANARIWP